MMHAMKTFSRVVTLAALVLAGGCASSPEISRDVSPLAHFGTYRTFAFFSPLATDRAGYESVLTSRLKDATRRSMEGKGYVYQDTNPDLLLNFYVNVRDKQELVTTPVAGPTVGYYGYRRGYYGGISATSVETVSYREGTLTIDLVEAGRKLLVWQATAVGSVSAEARKNPGPAIDSAVTKLMEPLPAAAQ
jgi:hypothetical protein